MTRKVPPRPPGATTKPDAATLEGLAKALNDMSARAAPQWLGYLSLWAYLFFTTVAVTDYDLIVLPDIKLPLIGTELGLFSFFVWAPALFLLVQLYVARKVVLVAETVRHYLRRIGEAGPTPAALDDARARMDAFAVTGLLARFDRMGGTRPDWFLRVLTRATVLLTLLVLPVALYVAFEAYFLAYHDAWVTWWHRIALMIGTAVALFTTRRAGGFDDLAGKVAAVTLGGASLGAVTLSMTLLTFPGEAVRPDTDESMFELALLYFGGMEVPNVLRPRQPDALFEKALARVKSVEEARVVDLAGREFSKRDFRGARLHGANLSGAILSYVNLIGADLTEARMTSAVLDGSNLSGAHMWGVDLRGAEFYQARMIGAQLGGARLAGANLREAKLHGAVLSMSELVGADLAGTEFPGANLDQAQLQATRIIGTLFHDALIVGARLSGAYVSLPGLIGVWVEDIEINDIYFEEKYSAIPDFIDFDALVKLMISEYNEYKSRGSDSLFLEQLSSSDKDMFDLIAASAEFGSELVSSSRASSPRDRGIAFANLVCGHPDGLFIIRRFSDFIPERDVPRKRPSKMASSEYDSVYSAKDALAILFDEKRCPIKAQFTERDVARLNSWGERQRLWLLDMEADSWIVAAGEPVAVPAPDAAAAAIVVEGSPTEGRTPSSDVPASWWPHRLLDWVAGRIGDVYAFAGSR